MLTRIVPTSEYRVNGSDSIRVAQMELNTRPDACSGDSITSGNVVIWMLDPSIFDMRNRSIPIYTGSISEASPGGGKGNRPATSSDDAAVAVILQAIHLPEDGFSAAM
jgi:hypothetical protein